MSCFTALLIRFIKEWTQYQKGLSSEPTEDDKYIHYFENIYEFHNDEIFIDVVYSIAAGCLWMRLIYALRLTKLLGPLIKMIQIMISDIMTFLVLFFCDLIIFAAIGNLLFVSVE